MNLSKNEHSTSDEIIKNGSFFTPDFIVDIAKDWLEKRIASDDVIIDFGAGYGAFISRFLDYTNRCIATDFDDQSIDFLSKNFPSIKTIYENSLVDVNRNKYNLNKDDNLIIIGNPPYNDLTSQYKKGNKGTLEMDEIIRSRDLGVSFLKMYSLLKPKYICVLHPLSYLIKKSNFNYLSFFKENYILQKGIVFSSKNFENINSKSEFPVCLALYSKKENSGMNYEYIENFRFSVLENGGHFSLVDIKTIDGWVNKYPKKANKLPSDLQFYTLRDINALKRNKTFLVGDIANGVKVEIESLYKYAWLDYFKTHFKNKHYFLYGNLSPLYSDDLEKPEIKRSLVSYIFNNNEIVLKYIKSNNLEDTLLKHYNMNHFNYDQRELDKIIKNITI